MSQLPKGYSEDDCVQHGQDTPHRWSPEIDRRSPFQHDVDRILYSAEFRALAGKTQVVASDQFGNYHNRLTHSLKVAQIGKRLASLLAEHARDDGVGDVGPNPDLVEAACLIHDIGHPPFGHVGEEEMARGMDGLLRRRCRRDGVDPSEIPDRHRDGFQANAQNLRIATYLAVRQSVNPRGLHLSRATLDAAIKYPWHRGVDDTHGGKHWGCYSTESDHLLWVRKGVPLPDPPRDKAQAETRPIEEQIMDWADEVTYACHDVEDFYRAGLIPLGEVLAGLPASKTDPRPGAPTEPRYETRHFLDYLKALRPESYDEDAVLDALLRAKNTIGEVFPYEDNQVGRGSATAATSSLLAYFLGKRTDREREDEDRKVRLVPAGDGGQLTRYAATLYVDPQIRQTCNVLTDLIRCYVIDRSGLATQQQGQRRIMRDLLKWYADDPKRLLPENRLQEFKDHGDSLRVAADTVSGFTEAEAVRVHRRMAGYDYGQVGDVR